MRMKILFSFFVATSLVFVSQKVFSDFYAYQDSTGVLHLTNVPTTSNYTLVMKERGQKSHYQKSHYTVRSGRFEDIIHNTSSKYGVDPHLVKALVKAESNFNANAVSRAGARGLMQLMPETARLMGVGDIHDPKENIEGGTKYFRTLMDTFGNDVSLALAAYNAGETVVVRYGSVPPYPETKRFVRKVLGYYETYRNGEE